jgi:N-methylhydantoinase A
MTLDATFLEQPSPQPSPRGIGSVYSLGIDIGGTFTDVILADHAAGRFFTAKRLTTPADLALGSLQALEDALRRADGGPGQIARVVHATTLATNLLLEGKQPPVAFLTTAGFKDIFRIQGVRRPSLYDLLFERPRPPVDEALTFEVPERINRSGVVVRPLDETAVRQIAARLADHRPAAIAICFLHAYRNPEHERRVAAILAERLPDAYVALSSEIWPEYREYERAVATVLSAYLGPVIRGYVQRLASELRERGIPASLQVMQSNGGAMSAATTAARPLFSIESGPAAGVLAAAHFGADWGYRNVIAFDMGGTTAKAAVVPDGRPLIRHDFRVGGEASAGGSQAGRGGLPVHMPVIDLAEVGAGGGSVAWVDSGGALQVGPQSAGAQPGPACYGFGGAEPTVTDANLVLGYLSPHYFLGGAMKLDPERSERAIAEKVAAPLGLSVSEGAAAIHEIANANMTSAIQLVTVERGIDPREFVLVAFGGAGPAHIARLAEAFDLRTVVIPRFPGLFATLGLLASDLSYDRVRTVLTEHDDLGAAEANRLFEEMEAGPLADLRREGFAEGEISVHRSVDARYRHQGYELNVPVATGHLGEGELAAFREGFLRVHQQQYGTTREEPVEYVNFRVRVSGRATKVTLPDYPTGSGDAQAALKGTRPALFREAGGHRPTPVYDRARLEAGMTFSGPAIVEETESTTVVPPDWAVTVDRFGNLLLKR